MKDFLGNELKIGDEVVFMQVGYRCLLKGNIISMGAQKAKMSHQPTNVGQIETIQFYDQIVKINK